MRQDVHCAELVIDNAIGAASFVLRHFMTSLFFYLRQKSDVRLAGRVSPRNTLREQLSFPFFQKAVDFYDERMESLRVVLVGSSQSSHQRSLSLPIIQITFNFQEN